MTTWQRVDISDEKVDFIEDNQQPGSEGLSSTPELLHGDFNSNAHHLADVQSQHKQVLVTAGMIPEEHIANVEPSLKLEWMVNELNGRMNPDGLTIPLLGVEQGQVELYSRQIDKSIVLKLKITEDDGDTLERELTAPEGVTIDNLTASLVNNRLNLRW